MELAQRICTKVAIPFAESGAAALQGPVIKQTKLGKIVGDAAKAGAATLQQALDAVVAHAFAATSGERELYQIVDVASGFTESIYMERHTAKGEATVLQVN